MLSVHVGGDNTFICLSRCRHSDSEGYFFLLDSSLDRCLDQDNLGVSPQRGTQDSCVGESGQRRTKRGVDFLSWMLAEKRRLCCGQGRVFTHHHLVPVFLKFVWRDPP